jgi:hypothetical protein
LACSGRPQRKDVLDDVAEDEGQDTDNQSWGHGPLDLPLRSACKLGNSQEGNAPSKPLVEMHPIAKVPVGQILGLVEAVDEVGGSADVATISQEVEMDIDRLGPIIDAAEFLGFIKVEDGDLTCTDLSRKVLNANVRERKNIIRDIIDDVPIFKQVAEMARAAGRSVSREEVLGVIAAQYGSHNAENLFNALVYWGRYTELVHYDSKSEELTIRMLRES